MKYLFSIKLFILLSSMGLLPTWAYSQYTATHNYDGTYLIKAENKAALRGISNHPSFVTSIQMGRYLTGQNMPQFPNVYFDEFEIGFSGFPAAWADEAQQGDIVFRMPFSGRRMLFRLGLENRAILTLTGTQVAIGNYFNKAIPNGYALAVNGNIVAREIKVSVAAFADYVFSPSYRLRPLSEVEQYINNNGHLPEVPSAVEVAEEGMNVGEMENTLLKKIEELTLYVIEQNKKLEALQQENQQQDQQIEQLRTKGKNKR